MASLAYVTIAKRVPSGERSQTTPSLTSDRHCSAEVRSHAPREGLKTSRSHNSPLAFPAAAQGVNENPVYATGWRESFRPSLLFGFTTAARKTNGCSIDAVDP